MSLVPIGKETQEYQWNKRNDYGRKRLTPRETLERKNQLTKANKDEYENGKRNVVVKKSSISTKKLFVIGELMKYI